MDKNLRCEIVLEDCKDAIKAHDLSLRGEKLRGSWVLVVTLLRAVGYVLSKVDAQAGNRRLKEAIEQRYNCWKSTKPYPEIYWGFINQERHNLIKQYEFGFKREIVFKGIGPEMLQLSIDLTSARGGGGSVGDHSGVIQSKITSGVYMNQDEVEVAWLAYNFWRAEIDIIKKKAFPEIQEE